MDKKSKSEDLDFLARPKGFEPPTFRIGIYCAIQLRYGRIYKRRDYPDVFYLISARMFSSVLSAAFIFSSMPFA